MFRNLDNRQRLYILGGGLVFLLLASMFYSSILNDKKKKHHVLVAKTNQIQDADKTILQQRKTLENLNQKIIALNPNQLKISTHNEFIQYIEKVCLTNELKLVSLPNELLVNEGDYQVAEITLMLEGSYYNLLKGLFQIENLDHTASIKYLNLHIESIRRNFKQENHLVATVVLNRLLEK